MTSDRGTPASVSDGGDAPEPARDRPAKKKKHLPLWQETVLLLVLALVLAVGIKAFLAQAFYIPSESMEPGLIRNDRILVQKVSYWLGGEPQRGDVVVFEDPGGWLTPAEATGPENPVAQAMAAVGLYPEGGHLVKRVVGVAGDTITCCDDRGRISVNGVPLKEDAYIREQGTQCNGPMITSCNWEAGPVPEGHVFVMGDNRGRSADSTVHLCRPESETDCVSGDEFVPNDLVVGKVLVLLWPLKRFDLVGRPDSFADVPER